MSDEQEEKDRGFKIEDRRRFTTEGEARDDSGSAESRDAGKSSAAESKPLHDEADLREQVSHEALPGDLTFSTFVIGLATQAFMFLGAVPDPQTGVMRKDLPQAKAMIDILSMLGEKTAGNLDEHEARMMEEMLYELRIHYVKELREPHKEGGKN